MNTDSANKWLMLAANIGVLIGIVVVAVELNQTQIAMQGQASTMRSQMATDLVKSGLDVKLYELVEKLDSGQDLNTEELARGSMYTISVLRLFENLHYQHEIGVLDNEIWAANLRGLGNICRGALFRSVFPRWGESTFSIGYRDSFIELISEPCK